MGNNGYGQLGDGTAAIYNSPIRVGSVTLSMGAMGLGSLSYQWKKDGVDIPGATSATYFIASPHAADAGS
jgi:hypothetical protein